MSRWIVWVGPVLIVLAACVLYSASADHGRLTEDSVVVWNNPSVAGDSFGPALLGRFYANNRTYHRAIRPVTTLAHRLSLDRFGQDRSGFQWNQILLHGIAGALFALAVGQLLASPLAGTTVGLIFVCHAALTHSVLRLAGLSEILALCFSMIAVIAAHQALKPRVAREGRHRLSLSVCWLAILLAIWSKEMALVIVPPVLLMAWLEARRQGEGQRSTGALSDPIVLLIGAALATLVALGYRTFAEGTLPETVRLATEVHTDTGDDFSSRLTTGLASVLTYARLAFFPNALGTNYDFLARMSESALQLRAALGGTVLALFLIGSVVAWKKRATSALFFSSLALCATLASLGVIAPIGGYVNERCLYFLLPAVLGLVAWGVTTFLSKRDTASLRGVAVALGVVAAVLLGVRTMARAGDFTSQDALVRAQIETYPESARAHFDLGNLYLSQGNLEAASLAYEVALETDPELWMAWANVGVVYSRQSELSLAIRAYAAALQGMVGREGYRGEEARTRFNRGVALMKQNRNTEASEELLQTLQVFPNHLRAHASLGFIFSNHFKYDEQALYHLQTAIDLEADPTKRQSLAEVIRKINVRRIDVDQRTEDRENAGVTSPAEESSQN